MYEDYFKCENNRSIQIIKDIIVTHFETLDLDFDFKEKEIINTNYNSPKFCPITLNPTFDIDKIFLSVNSYSYWCQVVYQLSHELTHCFVYCHNNSEKNKASWIEETICEAISLYFLNYFYENWDKIELSINSPNYKASIWEYLNDVLNKERTKVLSNSKGYYELMEIEKYSQEKREDRGFEMFQLYFKLSDKNIKGLINYRDYIIENKKILNTEDYIKSFPNNEAVLYLCSLQNSILSGE